MSLSPTIRVLTKSIILKGVLEAVLKTLLPKLGIVALAPASMQALLHQFIKDAPLISGDVAAMASGDYSKREWLANRPKMEKQGFDGHSSSPSSRVEVTFKQLLEDWRRERSPEPSSVEAYEKRIKAFSKTLGHQVASRVTREDAQQWKREMLEATNNPSIKGINLKLDAVHTVFEIALNNGRLTGENPVKGLRISWPPAFPTRCA